MIQSLTFLSPQTNHQLFHIYIKFPPVKLHKMHQKFIQSFSFSSIFPIIFNKKFKSSEKAKYYVCLLRPPSALLEIVNFWIIHNSHFCSHEVAAETARNINAVSFTKKSIESKFFLCLSFIIFSCIFFLYFFMFFFYYIFFFLSFFRARHIKDIVCRSISIIYDYEKKKRNVCMCTVWSFSGRSSDKTRVYVLINMQILFLMDFTCSKKKKETKKKKICVCLLYKRDEKRVFGQVATFHY